MATAGGSERFHELDALRAFAMLLGILFHTGMVARELPDAGGEATYNTLRWATETSHDFRMPAFFVMAGFFAALVVARSGVAQFWRARLKRIGLPLLVGWLLLVPLLNVLALWGQELRGTDPPPVTAGLLLGEKLHHLWFLWYLLLYYAAALTLRALVARVPVVEVTVRRAFAAVIRSSWRLLVLVPITAALIWHSPLWTAVTPPTWTPSLWPFLYYGAFFGFGWLLYGQRELLAALRPAPVAHTLMALAASVAVLFVIDHRPDGGTALQATKAVALLLTALVTWSAILALLGWFHRWFGAGSMRVRYVADSAYWLYLGHLPLVLAMYYGLTDLGVPIEVKVVVVPLATSAILLFTYDRFVRHTAIGRVLHGPRAPRARSTAVPPAAAESRA